MSRVRFNDHRHAYIWGAVLLTLGAVAACGSDDSGMSRAGGSTGDGAASPGTGVGAAPATGGGLGVDWGAAGADGLSELPDEVEDEGAFRAPVATGETLWFANPESSRVALIHAKSLEARILSAGFRPTYVAAVPSDEGTDSAVVLNDGSDDATWFRVRGDEVESVTVETHQGANRWSVSPSGDWAVAFSAVEDGEMLDPTDGLQDVTVLDLESDTPLVTRLTVGYRPEQVVFDEAEERLFVVSEPGVSIVDLTGSTPLADSWIDLGTGSGRDVSVTPNGDFIFVRRTGSSSIEVVEVETGEVTRVELGAPVTDLDLNAEGTRAVAVVRENRELVVLPVPGIVDDPAGFDVVQVPGEVFGGAALTADGNTAALYTNAVESSRIVIVDLAEGDDFLSHRVVDVQAPVESVSTTPDGEHAIVLQGAAAGSNKEGAFSILALRAERFPRVVGTNAPTRHVAVASNFALITTSGGGFGTEAVLHEAHLVHMPSLQVDTVRLASPPTATGVLSDLGVGYVAQAHAEGRVTVFDFASDETSTLTGFELAAKVVE